MPGLKVFIKGLDKVVDFPTDTPMEVIEQSIKGGWNEIEKISGLPMDTASRMDRARYLGFDPDNVLTHGSPNKELNEIKREGLFDGVFASPGDASEYGGEFQHSFIPRSGKVADEGDVDFDYDQTIKTLKKEFPGESDDYYDELYEATANDKFDPWDDNILEKQGFEDAGEASWEAQRIRGKIAEDQGFDAVAMDDEFGVSYLLPAGTKARKLGATFDPTKKASSNLLASAAGATVGLGALAQSDESTAGLLGRGAKAAQEQGFNYVRAYNKSDPMSRGGSALFLERQPGEFSASIDDTFDRLTGTYGEHPFLGRSGPDVATPEEFRQALSEKLRGVDLDDFNLEHGTEFSTLEDIANSFNPDDIVDSAGAWDVPSLSEWAWDEIIDPLEKKGVQTKDGLVAFDEDIIKAPSYFSNPLSSIGAVVGVGTLARPQESAASQAANRLLQEGLLGQQSKAFNIPFPLLNKAGLKLQEFPQSLIAGGIGRGLETLSTGRENELTDEEIRSRAIGVGLDFL